MDECINRALRHGLENRGLEPANAYALAIWPGATWVASQGAGAAASRILKVMRKRGLVRWTSRGHEAWGWELTFAGIEAAKELRRGE